MKSTVDKRQLYAYVSKRIEHVINDRHVIAVINIMFEEMVKDLKAGVPIQIVHFGILSLPFPKASRKYWDFRFQKVMTAPGTRKLDFSLTERLSKKLRSILDMTCLSV